MKRALFLAAALAGCSRTSPPPPAPTPPAAPSSETAWVEPTPAEGHPLLEWPAVALAAPEGHARIAAPLRARVVAVRVAPGSRVHKGDPLVDVVMPELVQAAAGLTSADLRISAYRERVQQLEALRGEGLAKATDLAEARIQLAEAQAARTSSAAVLRGAGYPDSAAGELLKAGGTTALRATIDGTVTEVEASLGEVRDPAGDPLVQIAGEASVRIEARAGAEPEAPVRYTFQPQGRPALSVRRVGSAPEVNPADGTRKVWFTSDSPGALTAGQPGVLQVALAESNGAVTVPARAVRIESGRAVVFVQRGGNPQTLPVTVLATSPTLAVVRGELKRGDRVAADASRVEVPESPGSGGVR